MSSWKLSSLSHEEFSWKKARKGLAAADDGDVELSLDAIEKLLRYKGGITINVGEKRNYFREFKCEILTSKPENKELISEFVSKKANIDDNISPTANRED